MAEGSINTIDVSNVRPMESYDCDIVVVGVGLAGFIASIQAAENGLKVIGIEKQKLIGGNGLFIDGLFAIDSPLQKEKGFTVDRGFIMHKELEISQWVSNGELWRDFLDWSGPNIEWLLERGCQFDEVSDGEGVARFPVIHFFKRKKSAAGLFPPFLERAKNLGIEYMTETPAIGLKMVDGVVGGVYARKADGSEIEINAKAVFLGTGSYSGNREYLRERGWALQGVEIDPYPYNGDGITFAIQQAGARSLVPFATFNAVNRVGKFFYQSMFVYNVAASPGDTLWVNERAQRFIYEDFTDMNYMAQCVPALTQKQIYAVFDRALLEGWAKEDTLFAHKGFTRFNLAEVDSTDDPDLWKGEDLTEGARYFGLDPEQLQTTVARYNEVCYSGIDDDFGKASKHLKPIKQGPFYIAHITSFPGVMIGGVETDINWQVINQDKNPIPNLYAIGTDGCMLFRTIYSFDTTCAACGAAMIHSGRRAANHATAVIRGKN
jgi:fumarate reductase flavoprotein subunit